METLVRNGKENAMKCCDVSWANFSGQLSVYANSNRSRDVANGDILRQFLYSYLIR